MSKKVVIFTWLGLTLADMIFTFFYVGDQYWRERNPILALAVKHIGASAFLITGALAIPVAWLSLRFKFAKWKWLFIPLLCLAICGPGYTLFRIFVFYVLGR